MKKFLFPVIALCFSMSFAQFEDDEWADFDYEHAGLTQTEFQNVKEAGISKEKLMHLLEIGVRPSVYLKDPWKDLGVSESEWLEQRANGMEDSEIDRTYKNQAGSQGLAYLSFLLPSLYQWDTEQTAKAVAMNILEACTIGLTIFLATNGSTKGQWVYGAGSIVAVHIWSGADAVLTSQWDNNPDARNFSWGIIPTGKKSFAAAATLRF